MTRVAVRIMGGLGNQLFQYAAGRSLAKRLEASLILDCTVRGSRKRQFALGHYPIKAEVICSGPSTIRTRRFRISRVIGKRIASLINERFPPTIWLDKQLFRVISDDYPFHYDPRFQTLTGSIYLTGFWQSYRYFEGDENTLRCELNMQKDLSDNNAYWLRLIRNSISICVHVRRGDYLQYQERFGLCRPSYYEMAVQYIRERVVDPRFFIFSDEIAWCRQNLQIEGATFVDANGPDNPIEEITLMASCRHHIIANSTLSWWGAWIAKHPEQIVIAPYPWFIYTTGADLLPEHWIRMPPGFALDPQWSE